MMRQSDLHRVLAALVLLALPPVAGAQTEARYYSGTFAWRETLTARNSSGSHRLAADHMVSISMVITDGVVMCRGGVDGKSQQWYSGALTEDSATHGIIDGIGIINIEFSEGGMHSVGPDEVELDEDTPSYNITITCPSPAVTSTGGGETIRTPAEDARQGSSWEIQTYDWPGAYLQSSLRGNATWNHPATDPVNGVTGTVTVEWDLVKQN
jgi:hypothetical protein